jgi:hypothetical protein
MIGFMDVIHVDEKPATGTSDLYYEVGLAIYLLPCRTAALVTDARIYQGRDPRPGLRKYLNQTIHGPFREAQLFLDLMLQQRDQGRAPRAAIITLNQFLDQWLSMVATPRRTFHDYESLLRLYIRRFSRHAVDRRHRTDRKCFERGLFLVAPAPHPIMRASPPPS